MMNKFELAPLPENEDEKPKKEIESTTPEVVDDEEYYENLIDSANSFSELSSILEEIGGIKLPNDEIFTSEHMLKKLTPLAEFVRNKKEKGEPLLDDTLAIWPLMRLLDTIPETYGLKKKLDELMGRDELMKK